MSMLVLITIVILSFGGLLISSYFTLVYHHLMPADSKLIPKLCRLEGNTCELILRTRDAAVFGIPNFYLGIVFYLDMLYLSFDLETLNVLRPIVLFISAVTVLLGLYLTYSLLWKHNVNCVLCYVSHTINFLIFLLLLLL